MRERPLTDIAASVHQRLLNKARETGRPFNELLQYFAMERFLYRLAESRHGRKFILKGALMLTAWHAPASRPTMDIDLLGQTDNSVEAIASMMRDACTQPVAPDGLAFDADSIQGQRIVEDADYGGVRIRFTGAMGKARLFMQIDTGFGDVVMPTPEPVEYPTLLEFPPPELLGYSRESTIAEKLEAMVKLGLLNSRMKDYYDIWLLSRQFEFSGERLCQAISATFSRRKTPLPSGVPAALSEEFAADRDKRTQWRAFVRRSRLEPGAELDDVVAALREFLMSPTSAIVAGRSFTMIWPSVGGWVPSQDPEP